VKSIAVWPAHALLALGAVVCWLTAAPWFAAVFTVVLAATGVIAEVIARRCLHPVTAPPWIRSSYSAQVIPGAPALGPNRKALTAGASTKED
jgi:hypothetical protein